MALGYETLIITHPEIADEEIQGIIDKLKEAIINSGGELLKFEKWGKRKLVYKVKGLSKGFFFIIYFLGNQVSLQALNKIFRYNERVLRYQTIRLDKKFNFESLREKEPKEKIEGPEEKETVLVKSLEPEGSEEKASLEEKPEELLS